METRDSLKTTFHRGIMKDDHGNMDYDFIRLANKQQSLTFLTKFLNHRYNPPWWETPFEEIKFTTPAERINPDYKYLLKDQPKTKLSIQQFTQNIVDGVKKYIVVNLKEGEKYLMLHSGGYDSRIISSCMRDLWLEGLRFDIHFRCHQPEGPQFLEIMKRQGWNKDQFSIFEGAKENYYNIGDKNNTLNGWNNYNQSMNFWSDIVPDESKYFVITGLMSESFKYIAMHGKENFPRRSDNRFIDILLHFTPDEGQWDSLYMMEFKDLLMPLGSYTYLEHALTVDPEWCKFNGKTDTIRIEITKRFKYNITDIPYGRHDYSWNLTDKFFKKLENDFYDSVFYKNYGKYLSKKPDFTKLYGWDAKLWGFMTVYDAIFKNYA